MEIVPERTGSGEPAHCQILTITDPFNSGTVNITHHPLTIKFVLETVISCSIEGSMLFDFTVLHLILLFRVVVFFVCFFCNISSCSQDSIHVENDHHHLNSHCNCTVSNNYANKIISCMFKKFKLGHVKICTWCEHFQYLVSVMFEWLVLSSKHCIFIQNHLIMRVSSYTKVKSYMYELCSPCNLLQLSFMLHFIFSLSCFEISVFKLYLSFTSFL